MSTPMRMMTMMVKRTSHEPDTSESLSLILCLSFICLCMSRICQFSKRCVWPDDRRGSWSGWEVFFGCIQACWSCWDNHPVTLHIFLLSFSTEHYRETGSRQDTPNVDTTPTISIFLLPTTSSLKSGPFLPLLAYVLTPRRVLGRCISSYSGHSTYDCRF